MQRKNTSYAIKPRISKWKKEHVFFWLSLGWQDVINKTVIENDSAENQQKIDLLIKRHKQESQDAMILFMSVKMISNAGVFMGDAEARHLDMKLLPLSIDELDTSMPYILRSLGLARSLVLGMHSGIPSRSSRVDWRENSVVASVRALRGGESNRWDDQWWKGWDGIYFKLQRKEWSSGLPHCMIIKNMRCRKEWRWNGSMWWLAALKITFK